MLAPRWDADNKNKPLRTRIFAGVEHTPPRDVYTPQSEP